MASQDTAPRFEELTEATGIPLTREAATMMYTRYHVAAGLARGRRVLELGCGAGQGFGLIAKQAKSIVGGDCSRPLLELGRQHYGERVPLAALSADHLPFTPGFFDLVLFFEASYYVPDMGEGFREIVRVLAPGGTVLFVNANPDRPDFISSPHSVHYHTADEFRRELSLLGMTVSVDGAFPVETKAGGIRTKLTGLAFSFARRTLEAIGLVPRTLRGRARLKRLIYGRLLEVPAELPEGFAGVAPVVPQGPGPVRGFKILYVTARRSAC